MFDTKKLYIECDEPSIHTIIIKYSVYVNGFLQNKLVTYGMCKNIHPNLMYEILTNTKHDLRNKYWHNIIINSILYDGDDCKYNNNVSSYIYNNKYIDATLQMYCALVYMNSCNIHYVPKVYHDEELLEDALFYSKNNFDMLSSYIYYYQPNRLKKYIKNINENSQLRYKLLNGNNYFNFLKFVKQLEHDTNNNLLDVTRCEQYYTLINECDILEQLKKDKKILFVIPQKFMNYNIFIEAIKQYGNFVFINSKCFGTKIEYNPYPYGHTTFSKKNKFKFF